MTLTLISIGLKDQDDLSIRAINAAKETDYLYAEMYTMKLDTTIQMLSVLIGKKVQPLKRIDLEENNSELLRLAKNHRVGVLVGGDALSATTHISLLIDAEKQGIETKVVHGSSIITAVAESGLSLYKFGKTVTIPLPEKGPVDTVIKSLKSNKEDGLHTLLLLDLNIPDQNYLTIKQAIKRLEESDDFDMDTLMVGFARIGYENSVMKADKARHLVDYDFGDPPHVIVVPGVLHFIEEEALKVLCDCPVDALKDRDVKGELDKLIEKYSSSCMRVLEELNLGELPLNITEEEVREMLDHARRYLDDAKFYWGDKNEVALAAVSYSEGILDALKLLGLVDFEW